MNSLLKQPLSPLIPSAREYFHISIHISIHNDILTMQNGPPGPATLPALAPASAALLQAGLGARSQGCRGRVLGQAHGAPAGRTHSSESWSNLLQGLELDKSSSEALAVLLPLMEWLESQKKEHKDNDAVTNEVVASAHIENYAMKLFLYADKSDRAGNFGKNVVKAFYSSGVLFDVMQTFGELTPEVAHFRKYAKMKAAYIHNCLKNGEVGRKFFLFFISILDSNRWASGWGWRRSR